MLSQAFPILGVIKGYTADDWKRDVSAGFTVAAMLVPQSMAYATLAGVAPEVGLYTCITPLLVYSALGSSRQLALGPSAILSLLTGSALGEIAKEGATAHELQQLASALAFFVGCLQLLMGLVRLDFLAKLLSHPVLSGFTSASACLIMLSQINGIFGLALPRSKQLHVIASNFVHGAGDAHGWTMLTAASCIAFLLCSRRLKRSIGALRKVPEALVLVVVVTLISAHVYPGKDTGVALVGHVPPGLPSPQFPEWGNVGLLGTSLPIALIAFLESFAIAKAFASKEGYEVDPKTELVALGLSNLVGSFFQSMPVAGSFSRSAVNFQAGSKSTLSSVVTALSCILCTAVLTPAFAMLPKPALAAIIVVAVSGLIDTKTPKTLWHMCRPDFAVLLCTIVCTLFIGVLEGIAAGVACSIVIVLHKAVNPHGAELVQVCKDPPVYRNRKRFPGGKDMPSTVIFRLDAPLFFANFESVGDRLKACAAQRPGTKFVVLHCGSISHLDSSGAHSVQHLSSDFDETGITMLFAEWNGPCRDMLGRAHRGHEHDDQTDDDLNRRCFATLHEAVQFAVSQVLEPAAGANTRTLAQLDACERKPNALSEV